MQKFRTTRLTSALAMGAFGFLAACAPKTEQATDTLATTPPATAATPTMDAPWTDANVVDVLSVANQGEVDYSQIGVEKATDPGVKAFARLMVKDHGAMVEAVKRSGDQARTSRRRRTTRRPTSRQRFRRTSTI